MAKPILTQAYLKECLHYDPETGIFTWMERPRNHFKTERGYGVFHGKNHKNMPGRVSKRGYYEIGFAGERYRAHRLAWLYMTGKWPDADIDHINHIRTDNRWCNLRSVDRQANNCNRTLIALNTSGFTGVSYNKRTARWEAYIGFCGKKIKLGLHKEKQEAINARIAANLKFGFHQNHGLEICQS